MSESARGLSPVGVDHPALRTLVAGEIRKVILTGHFRSGERLVEEELARGLGVSRNPVREALTTLEAEGLVEVQRKKGAVVRSVSMAEAAELFEVRETLEALAARLAARRQNRVAIEEMEGILKERRRAINDRDVASLSTLNTRFHELVALAGENKTAAQVLSGLRNKSELVYVNLVLTKEVTRFSWTEHQAILDAVKKGDEWLAGKLAADHVARAYQVYRESLGTDPMY